MSTPIPSIKTEKRDYWADQVKQYLASGKTQREYCEQHQLKLHQLVYWKGVFTDQPKSKETNTPSGFVAMQLIQPSTAIPSDTHLSIELPSGICIKGIRDNNLDLIKKIIGWQS